MNKAMEQAVQVLFIYFYIVQNQSREILHQILLRITDFAPCILLTEQLLKGETRCTNIKALFRLF